MNNKVSVVILKIQFHKLFHQRNLSANTIACRDDLNVGIIREVNNFLQFDILWSGFLPTGTGNDWKFKINEIMEIFAFAQPSKCGSCGEFFFSSIFLTLLSISWEIVVLIVFNKHVQLCCKLFVTSHGATFNGNVRLVRLALVSGGLRGSVIWYSQC